MNKFNYELNLITSWFLGSFKREMISSEYKTSLSSYFSCSYTYPDSEIALNFITLQVSVPVLSVRIYLTVPSSSRRLLPFTSIGSGLLSAPLKFESF